MNTILKTDSLTLGYGGKQLVGNINLEINQGDFWSIIGPNGQGKSSFIKAILGLVTPLSGKIIFSDLTRQQIGYVPQSSTITPHLPMTAEEFISIGIGALPFFKNHRQKISHSLEEVKLLDKKARTYWTLSGGERQRLHIARALAQSPRVLILDEPDTGLDFVAIENLLEILKALHLKHNLTVIMITHNLSTAQRISSHCALFTQGKVLAGSCENILTKENIQQAYSLDNDHLLQNWLTTAGNTNA